MSEEKPAEEVAPPLTQVTEPEEPKKEKVTDDHQEKQSKEPGNIDKLFSELEKLDPSMLPPEMQSVDIAKLKQTFRDAKILKILLTGKTGSGKSTLTNGLLGVNVKEQGSAQEGRGIQACTQEVTEYVVNKGDTVVTVWDSPGLQDGTKNQDQYVKQMTEKCADRDLTIYCIRISDIRFVSGDDNPDVVAMKKLTKAFGNEFWENTVIVLTFSNTLEAFNLDWEDMSAKEKAHAFEETISEWEKGIKDVLVKDIGVPEEIARKVVVVPAGHYRRPHLPGRRFWLSALWFRCLETLPSPEKKAVLVKMNEDRLKREEDVSKEDFKKSPENQPIVVDKDRTAKAVAGGSLGAGIGAVVGGAVVMATAASTVVLAPFVAVGAAIGAIVGGCTIA